MKKILLLLSSLVIFDVTAQTEYLKVGTATANRPHFTPQPQNSAVQNLDDTLMYVYNKHLFRNVWNGTSTSPNLLFYTIPAPYTTTTNISHCGSVFRNTGTVVVTGAQGLVMRRPSAPTPSVPIKLYICTTNISLVPQMPPIDSTMATISNSTAGDWVGGNFTNPVTVTGNFAILFRNGSTTANDTVRLFLNNAATATSTMSAEQRYGEGLGVMRVNGNFQTTSSAFGGGGDYEFIVAPRVQVSYTANATAVTSTLCNNAQGTFSNTTVNQQIVESRFFNFNQFYKHWSPWAISTNSLIQLTQPDSVYQWNYTGSSSPTSYKKHGSAIFTTAGVQTASLTAFYQQSANPLGNQLSVPDGAVAQITVSSAFAPQITVTGSSVICSGTSATLVASGNPTFTWSPGNVQNATYIVSPTGTTVYTVTGADQGCTGITLFTVSVTQPPNVSITGPTDVCDGKLFTLTGNGATSYTWSSGSNNAAVTLTASGIGIQTFTLQGANGNCPPVSTVKNINVNPSPVVSITAPVNTLCTKATTGETMTLYGDPSGGKFSGTGIINGVFNPNTTGNFIATYTYTDATTGCASNATTAIAVVNCTGFEKIDAVENVVLFPNPSSTGIFNLANLVAGTTVEVYNVAGALVRKVESTTDQLQVNLGTQPAGIYLVKVRASGKDKTFRLINGN